MYLYILSCHSKKRPQAKTDPKDEIIKKADIEQMSTKCNQECSQFCALISSAYRHETMLRFFPNPLSNSNIILNCSFDIYKKKL